MVSFDIVWCHVSDAGAQYISGRHRRATVSSGVHSRTAAARRELPPRVERPEDSLLRCPAGLRTHLARAPCGRSWPRWCRRTTAAWTCGLRQRRMAARWALPLPAQGTRLRRRSTSLRGEESSPRPYSPWRSATPRTARARMAPRLCLAPYLRLVPAGMPRRDGTVPQRYGHERWLEVHAAYERAHDGRFTAWCSCGRWPSSCGSSGRNRAGMKDAVGGAGPVRSPTSQVPWLSTIPHVRDRPLRWACRSRAGRRFRLHRDDGDCG